jgi:hypothetical protein
VLTGRDGATSATTALRHPVRKASSLRDKTGTRNNVRSGSSNYLAVPPNEGRMKKVLTDPRILTGQKNAVSLTQWYDDELNEMPAPGSQLNSSSALDQSQGSVSLHDMSETASLSNSRSNGHLGSISSQVSDAAHERSEREQLTAKINRMNDQLQSEQESQELSVNEYLRLSNSIPPKDRAQAQRIKSAFERRNQKSTVTIAQLQRKLEMYKGRLRAIDAAATAAATTAVPNPVGGGSPWPAMGVLRGIRSLFDSESISTNIRSGISGFSGSISKPKQFTTMLRKQFGSADNIAAIKMDAESLPENHSEMQGIGRSTLPASFRCHSDEDLSKLSSPGSTIATAMSLASPTFAAAAAMAVSSSVGSDRLLSDVAGQQQHSQVFVFPEQVAAISTTLSRDREQDKRRRDSSVSRDSVSASVLDYVQSSRQALKEQRAEISALKKGITASQAKWKEMLESEKERNEHLAERLNDLTDLHQHELMTVQQELSMFEEKLAYQLDERMRDMQEMVDNCHNRLARLEIVQQRSSIEGINHTQVRTSVVKLINVALSILALILVLISFAINLFGPFVSTRSRTIATAVTVVSVAVIWYSWDLIMMLSQRLAMTVSHRLPE